MNIARSHTPALYMDGRTQPKGQTYRTNRILSYRITTDPGSQPESQPASDIGDERRTDTTSGFSRRERPTKERRTRD
jgi:hypothetical protein